MAKGTWTYIGWREEVYADETGRVLGSVRDSSRTTTATVDGKGSIGEYITSELAKAAVERALAEPPHA